MSFDSTNQVFEPDTSHHDEDINFAGDDAIREIDAGLVFIQGNLSHRGADVRDTMITLNEPRKIIGSATFKCRNMKAIEIGFLGRKTHDAFNIPQRCSNGEGVLSSQEQTFTYSN